MATTTERDLEANLEDNLHETVGDDATATFETRGNHAESNPTAHSSSESLYAAGQPNAARDSGDSDLGLSAAADEEDEDDEEEEDEEDDEDLDDDEDDEDDEDDLDDDEEDFEDDDDEEEDDEDDDDDATLKMEPTDSIRGRATDAAKSSVRRSN